MAIAIRTHRTIRTENYANRLSNFVHNRQHSLPFRQAVPRGDPKLLIGDINFALPAAAKRR